MTNDVIPAAPMAEAMAWSLDQTLNQPNRRIVFERHGTFYALGDHATSIAVECDLATDFCEYPDTGRIVKRLRLDREGLDRMIERMTDRGFNVLTVEVMDE